jgi:hypothetical protein
MLLHEELAAVLTQLRQAAETKPGVPLLPLGEDDSAHEAWATPLADPAVRRLRPHLRFSSFLCFVLY